MGGPRGVERDLGAQLYMARVAAIAVLGPECQSGGELALRGGRRRKVRGGPVRGSHDGARDAGAQQPERRALDAQPVDAPGDGESRHRELRSARSDRSLGVRRLLAQFDRDLCSLDLEHAEMGPRPEDERAEICVQATELDADAEAPLPVHQLPHLQQAVEGEEPAGHLDVGAERAARERRDDAPQSVLRLHVGTRGAEKGSADDRREDESASQHHRRIVESPRRVQASDPRFEAPRDRRLSPTPGRLTRINGSRATAPPSADIARQNDSAQAPFVEWLAPVSRETVCAVD